MPAIMWSMLPLRVFVSSTSTDLQEHRQVVRDAIMSLDHHPNDMIYWSADARSGMDHSLDRVRQCDVLILVVAHRYGHVAEGADFSVTEMEYRAARAAEIPVLAFFLDPSVPWPPDHVEWEAKQRLDAFKDLVGAQVTRKLFRTTDELAAQVVQALAQLELRRSTDRGSSSRRFTDRVRNVSLPGKLTSDPDVLVQIGTAEDGLPLLLDVYRSRGLSNAFAELATAVGRRVPQALLETFRQSFFEFGTAERLMPVLRVDGETETLYVSSFTLGQSFTSILVNIIDGSARGTVARTPEVAIQQGSASVINVWLRLIQRRRVVATRAGLPQGHAQSTTTGPPREVMSQYA